jgi:hypothetical protein
MMDRAINILLFVAGVLTVWFGMLAIAAMWQ